MLGGKLNRGFTLIELLVVIAIIAILAAILFPVFISAKEQGRTSGCLNNLRQLGSAVNMYVDDNTGRYPCAYRIVGRTVKLHPNQQTGYVTWDVAIIKYVKNIAIFKCPSDGAKRLPFSLTPAGVEPRARSYTYNDQVIFDTWLYNKNPQPHPDTWTQSEIRGSGSSFVMLFDYYGVKDWDIESNQPQPGVYASNYFGLAAFATIGAVQPKVGEHQAGRVLNYLYFDGHVTSSEPSRMNHRRMWGYLAGMGAACPNPNGKGWYMPE